MKRAVLERVTELRAKGESFALVTALSSGLATIVRDAVVEGGGGLPDRVVAAARQALATEKSQMMEDSWFIQAHCPPPRLMLVGAVHIAQAMLPMARQLGYGVTVIDPREAFADPERFPDLILGTTLLTDWPDEALAALKPDSRTAIVSLTHDPKLDDPALLAAIRSPAFYVGALGSRKTHAARMERLTKAGATPEQLARIHGPVGLDIGAVSQAEIALSALAQITAMRRLGPQG